MSVLVPPILREQVMGVTARPARIGTKLVPASYQHFELLASMYFTSASPKGAVRLGSKANCITCPELALASPRATRLQAAAILLSEGGRGKSV